LGLFVARSRVTGKFNDLVPSQGGVRSGADAGALQLCHLLDCWEITVISGRYDKSLFHATNGTCAAAIPFSPPVTSLALPWSAAPNGNWSGSFSLSTARDFAAPGYCNQSRRYLRASCLAVCHCNRGVTQEQGH
jgi:hypothetical protein